MANYMNITEHTSGPMRLFAVKTSARDVVAIQGSVLGGWSMLPKDQQMIPRLAAALLDAGTKKHSKEFIRTALASRGASISFYPGLDRTYFSANCLPEDTKFVLELIAECLEGALFSTQELALQKKRTLAEIDESKTDTRVLAAFEFYRQVYDKDHVHYAQTIQASIAHTTKASRADILSFKKLLGIGGLVLAITGDIEPTKVLTLAEKAFKILPKGTGVETPKKQNTKTAKASLAKIPLDDKANIDVFMGAHVPITFNSPEFIPLSVLTSMLGGMGLATGHLMRTIRERDGLTYGIYASLVGFEGENDGAFRIWATFSPATFEKAVAQTQKEISIFLSKGITEEQLTLKKSELAGKYAISLGTSAGLAGILHTIGVEGRSLSYIDEYPSLIEAVTLAELKQAASLVPWKQLTITASGTFEKGV